ncbi:MAG: thioredoxin domain-containing protein [Acetobacteraceae bacterium]|nr:thioredoxin domain-containing protein [Acetobacteraceae bacterium]
MTAANVNGQAAFAASEDADSEGVEGKFYVWTEAKIDHLLGPASAAFKTAFDVSPAGNWEGHTILRRADNGEDTATLAAARAILLNARDQRVRPGRDDKVLADWNGLAIAALARAAFVFNRPDWLAVGQTAYGFVRDNMATATPHGLRLSHAWRLGRVTAAGLLDDHAVMARAALALFEATGTQSYLADAIAMAKAAETWFAGDGEGSYFTTASDATDIPLGPAARPRIAADNATPAGNGVMAAVLARLYHLTGDAAWRRRAEALLMAFGGLGDRLAAAPSLLAAADLLEAGTTVVVAGPQDAHATLDLLSAALAAPDPAVMVLRASDAHGLPRDHPAFGKTDIGGQAAAYLCRGNVCGLPITDPARLAAQLRGRYG